MGERGDAALLQRFEAAGFRPGLLPQEGPAPMRMEALTRLLLAVFDGSPARLPGTGE